MLLIDGRSLLRRGRCHTWGEETEGGSVEQLISEGFVLTRSWKFDPGTFDFTLLEDELVIATKSVFARMQGINAFALFTDDGAMTIGASAHRFESIGSAPDEELWNPPEWSLGDDGTDFDIPYRLILSQHRYEGTRVDFATFRERFKATLVKALKRIEFGEVVVLVSVNDIGESMFISPPSLHARFTAATTL